MIQGRLFGFALTKRLSNLMLSMLLTLTPIDTARKEFHTIWEEHMRDNPISTNTFTDCLVVGTYVGVAYLGKKPERIQSVCLVVCSVLYAVW
jgi:hypothetical protein